MFSLIEKYSDYFNFGYINYNKEEFVCTSNKIIKAIDSVYIPKKKKDDHDYKHTSIMKIDDLIIQIKDHMKYYQKRIKESREKNENFYDTCQYYISSIKECRNKLAIIDYAKKYGIKYYIRVGFGDNHGEISGRGIGEAMHYVARNMKILEEDFVLFTEDNT